VPWPGQSPCNKKPLTRLAGIKGNKMPTYNPATDRIAELIGAHPRREPAKLAGRVQFRAHALDLAGPTP
jgi:hypothetical protein